MPPSSVPSTVTCERALTLLEQALKNGYSPAIARRDLDLDGIRQLPRFHQLVGSSQ